MKFYVSIFPNSKMTSLIGSGEGTVGRKGSAGGATFQLDGREFMEYNAGPHFNFAEGMSLYVDVVPKERSTCCGTSSPREEKREDAAGQGQVRRVMADSAVYFGEMLQDKDPERSKKVMAAMLKMGKLDISTLKQAYGK